MKKLLKKIFIIILSFSILLSSAGITIFNHICKEENLILTKLSKTECNETSSEQSNCCCCCTSQTTPTNQKPNSNSTYNTTSYQSLSNCCENITFSKSVPVVSNENYLKKLSENYKPNLKIEYIKNVLSDFVSQKIQTVQDNLINPIRKLIKLIRLITAYSTNPDFDSLH